MTYIIQHDCHLSIGVPQSCTQWWLINYRLVGSPPSKFTFSNILFILALVAVLRTLTGFHLTLLLFEFWFILIQAVDWHRLSTKNSKHTNPFTDEPSLHTDKSVPVATLVLQRKDQQEMWVVWQEMGFTLCSESGKCFCFTQTARHKMNQDIN